MRSLQPGEDVGLVRAQPSQAQRRLRSTAVPARRRPSTAEFARFRAVSAVLVTAVNSIRLATSGIGRRIVGLSSGQARNDRRGSDDGFSRALRGFRMHDARRCPVSDSWKRQNLHSESPRCEGHRVIRTTSVGPKSMRLVHLTLHALGRSYRGTLVSNDPHRRSIGWFKVCGNIPSLMIGEVIRTGVEYVVPSPSSSPTPRALCTAEG
jgi:hypothetical protein